MLPVILAGVGIAIVSGIVSAMKEEERSYQNTIIYDTEVLNRYFYENTQTLESIRKARIEEEKRAFQEIKKLALEKLSIKKDNSVSSVKNMIEVKNQLIQVLNNPFTTEDDANEVIIKIESLESKIEEEFQFIEIINNKMIETNNKTYSYSH